METDDLPDFLKPIQNNQQTDQQNDQPHNIEFMDVKPVSRGRPIMTIDLTKGEPDLSKMTKDERRQYNKQMHRAKTRGKLLESIEIRKQVAEERRQRIDTPEGKRQRLQDFKEMMLNTVNGTKVIRKVLEIAMEDGHPSQMVALKMCLDRQLPVSAFEDVKRTGHSAIQISITGVEPVAPTTFDEDGDITDV